MSDFTLWLRGLGLVKYSADLASHDIDLTVAPERRSAWPPGREPWSIDCEPERSFPGCLRSKADGKKPRPCSIMHTPTRWRNGKGPRSGSPLNCGRSLARISRFSGRRGNRLAGVGANPLDHGAQAVGALRRQMLAEAEFVEHRYGVGIEDLPRGVAGIQRQQDRDQPAHDMGVAVAEIVQERLIGGAAVEPPGQPDLAGAALHLVGLRMLGFGHRVERAAEFDDVPVAVVPIVQQRKIIPDFVDRHRIPHSFPNAYIG